MFFINNKIIRRFTVDKNKRNFFHTQPNQEFSSAEKSPDPTSHAKIEENLRRLEQMKKKALEENREYIKKYNSSKLFNSALLMRRAEKYTSSTNSSAQTPPVSNDKVSTVNNHGTTSYRPRPISPK